MKHARSLLVLVASASLFALSFGQGGGRDPDRLLDEVLKANQTLRFRGLRIVTFRSNREGNPKERQITELIVRDGRRSRTEYSGDDEMAGQIAVDDGVNRLQYLPMENVINRSPSLQNESGGRLESLLRARRKEFTVRVTEGVRVADHPTLMIELVGKEGNTHRIWVEKRGKAILKREVGGSSSDRGMSYEFQTFQYQPNVANSEFVIDKPGARVVGPEERLASNAKKIGVEPQGLAPNSGFMLFDSRGFMVGPKAILRSTYGNGKISVTLVQVKGELDQERLVERENRRIRIHVWRAGPYYFSLLGDLTPEDLHHLAGLVGG